VRQRFRPGKLLLGGHRGNPDEFPENTMASFASAIELGVDVIECDIHLTRDGRLAVIHDHTLDHTTNGKGPVGARTMAELKQLDAGDGQQIPELVEVLDLARGKVGVAVEVKNLPVKYPGIEERLVEAVRGAGMAEDSAAISFDHRVVKRVRELDHDIVGGVLVAGRPLMLPELLHWTDAEVYSPHWSYVDTETVAEVHGAGAVVGVWTVDDEETLARCQGLGVDAVYTNRPRRLLATLAAERTAPGT
jgi:glycerophosphoryl diester phosphodiesterase